MPVKSVSTIEQGPGAPLLEDEYSDTINPAATHVRLRGQVVPVRTDENYYWARAIDVEKLTHEQIDELIKNARDCLSGDVLSEQIRTYEDLRQRVGKYELHTWHFVRGLVPEYRDLLLANEEERREGVPDDLPLLLQLDDWDHPRLLEGDRPSMCESFRLIAKVLALRDPKQYEPTDEGNVHWRNWPASGSL